MIFAKTKEPNKRRGGKIPIFFFDSECALCDKLIMYLFNNTKKGELKFCSIHGDFADYIVRKHTGSRPNLRTSYLLINGFLYSKTDAILKSLLLTVEQNEQSEQDEQCKKKLIRLTITTLLKIIYALNKYVLVNRLFDYSYDFVSRNREKIIKSNICELPSSKYREEGNVRFIE